MNVVYKVMTPLEWMVTSKTGEFHGSPIDLADGYMHLSTASQVEQTVSRHFAKCGILVLVAVNVERLGAYLKFEPSRGGDLFPHLYSKLKVEDVRWAKEFDSDRPDELRNLVSV